MRICRLFSCLLLVLLASQAVLAADPVWKAGVATVVITPDQPTWMAGYASRTKPGEGKATELFAKALAFEDAQGNRAVIVTTDLIGMTRALRDAVSQKVEQQFKLPPGCLLLNASHTHCGPVVRPGKSTLYDLNPEQVEVVAKYVAALEQKLVAVVGQALKNLAPAVLGYSHARCGFAMNRRLPTDKGYQNSPYPEGPVDHDVPVLKVESADGKLQAILFGYACHNTTLSFFQFCGDYAGFAQEELEKSHPGTTALFLMGCGGDQNPYPRGTIELCRQHGRSLATAVDAALLPQARPLAGGLRTAYSELPLKFDPIPTREELQRSQQSSNVYERKHAAALVEELDKTGKLRTEYPCPLQVIQFGQDLTIVALAGETVVDYSLRIKREFPGTPLWVAGYSNDVFAYVPSLRVLKEGGYESSGAMLYTQFPGPFAGDVEERIMGKVQELIREVRSPK